MNINPFGTNNIYTNKKPKTMRGNQSYGLSFGVNENGGYDNYQSSAPKKEESFWEKWKNVIIAGTVAVGAVVLGVVGYNKGLFGKIKKWFGKTEAPKVAEKGSEVVQDEISQDLKTLNLGSLNIGNKTLTDLLKPNNKTVTKEQFVAVAREIKECDLTDNAVRKAAVAVLERLRKNLNTNSLDNNKRINGFDTTQEINDSVLDTILGKQTLSVNDKGYWAEPIATLEMNNFYSFPNSPMFYLSDILTSPKSVDRDSFFEVLRIVQKKLGTDNSTEKINAAIQIVEQLRKNFKDNVNIKSFNCNQPIENKETLQQLFDIANSVSTINEKDNFNSQLSDLIDLIKGKEKLTDYDVKKLFALYKKEIINSENISDFCKVLKVAIEKGIATEEHINDIMTVCQNEKQDVVASVLETAINNVRNDNKEKIQDFIGQFFKSCKDPSISMQVIKVAIEKGIATEKHIEAFINTCKDSHKYTDLKDVINYLKAFIENGEFANDSEKTKTIQSYITQFVNAGKQVEGNNKNTYIPTVAGVINVAIEKGIATEQHINDFIDASKDNQLLSFTANVLTAAIENEKFRKDAGGKTILNLIDKCIHLCQPNSSYNECFIPVLEAAIKNGIAAEKYIESFMPLCTDCEKQFAKVLTAAIEQGVATSDHINKFIAACPDTKIEAVASVLKAAINNNEFRDENSKAILKNIDKLIELCIVKGEGDYSNAVVDILTAATTQGMDVSDKIESLIQKCKTLREIEMYVSLIFRNVISSDNPNLKKNCVKDCIKKCIEKFIKVYTTRDLGIKCEAKKLGNTLYIAIKHNLYTEDEIEKIIAPNDNDKSSVLKRKIDAIKETIDSFNDQETISKEKINSFKNLLKPFIQTPNTNPEVLKAQISLIKAAINKGILKDDDDKTIIETFIDEPNAEVLSAQIYLISTAINNGILKDDDDDKTIIEKFIQAPNANPGVLAAQVSLIDTAIEKDILKDNDDKQIIEKFIQAPNANPEVLEYQYFLTMTYFQKFEGEKAERAGIKARIQLAKNLCKAQGFTDNEARIIGTELEHNLEVADKMSINTSNNFVSIIDTCKFILLMNDIKKEINKDQNEKINLTQVNLKMLSYKHLSKLLTLMTILYQRSLGGTGDDYNTMFQKYVLDLYYINESTIENLKNKIDKEKEAKISELATQEITLNNISENISEEDIKKLLPSSMQDIDTKTIISQIEKLKESDVYKSLKNADDKKLSILAVCLYNVAKKEGAMFIHDWLEKVSGLSEEQTLTISDIFYSLEIANPTRQAYELAYSRKNGNILSLVKCLNAAISTDKAPLFSDIQALEGKFKFIEKMLAHIKEQVKLTPFPSGAYQHSGTDIPQEVLYDGSRPADITVPIVDLTVVKGLSEDKQKQVFKALGMKEGTTWENFNFLVHGISYSKAIQPIQQMHESYKPNAVLCTSNYTHQNIHLYCRQGFILDSDQANILKANAEDIYSENKKTRIKIPFYINQYNEQKFDSYMANSNFHDREDYSELQASEIKVSAVFIDKKSFNFKKSLYQELIRFAQENNLPIILMNVIANQ